MVQPPLGETDPNPNNNSASATLDPDKVAERPTLTAPSALRVPAGGSIPLGVVLTPVDSDDVLSVVISGVPGFESVTAAGITPTVTSQGDMFTYTFNALPASDWKNGLILHSTFAGKGHPTNPLTVTASNTTVGEVSTAPSKTISVTDPPATQNSSPPTSTFDSLVAGDLPSSFGMTNVQTTVQNPVGSPPGSSLGLDHVVALFNQYMAAGFPEQQGGQITTNALSQVTTNEQQFLANPHHG
jgi:hypothetical protein